MSSYAILTNTGRNKEAAALANGSALNIAEIAWGDGDYAPSGGEIALENEIGRKPVQGQGTVDAALNTAFFEILLTEAEGPFVIHEAGLFDDAGDLIAIVKYDPPVNKPKDTVSALLRINVVFSDLENLIVQIDATTAFIPATRRVNTGDGLTGGGQLDQDLNLELDPVRLAAILLASGFISDDNLTTALSDYVTQSQMDAAFSDLIGAAPAVLDTLKEIADALADDDNAIAALTAQVSGKLNASSYTAADILAKLLTVDGAGTNLDADKLDGKHASDFVLASSYTAADILAKLRTVDGNGSGLDADTLDGFTSSQYRNATNLNAGTVSMSRLPIGTQAEAQAGTSNSKVMTPLRTKQAIDAAQDAILLNRLPTAWVNFNGQGTVSIRESHNVSSITDLGTGRYRVNFATPMANTNYAIFGLHGNAATVTDERNNLYIDGKTTTYAQFYTTNVHATPGDWDNVSIMIMGGQ